MSVPASVFRRGLKRELFDDGAAQGEINIEEADREQLSAELQQLQQVLEAPKVGQNWSAALWRPEVGAAEVVLSRGGTGQAMGFKWRRRFWLHIEEAVFLLDRSDLLLFIEDPGAGKNAQQRRLMSHQEAYELMVMAGVTMERYRVYTQLSRQGYLTMRYPSCWLLPDEATPADVWGYGAWKGCAGQHAKPLPEDVTDAAQHMKSLHQGVTPSTRALLEGEEEVENDDGPPIQSVNTTQPQAVHRDHAQAGLQQNAVEQKQDTETLPPDRKRQRLDSSNADLQADGYGAALRSTIHQQRHTGHQRETANTGHDVMKNNVQQASMSQQGHVMHRRWYPAIADLPDRNQTAGCSAEDNRQTNANGMEEAQPLNTRHNRWAVGLETIGHAVQLPVSDTLNRPRLKPLPTMSSGQLPGPPATSAAHLVYDVYKPGAHVSRNKRGFPTIACHIALCSSRPPRIQELLAADNEALAQTVPVKWAAVEGGIVTLYEIGPADILRHL